MSSADHDVSTTRMIERWAQRHLGGIDHELRVVSIAMKLHDIVTAKPRLDLRHRRLLMWGALVHDVGRSVEDDRHPQIGAKMIEAAYSLPISKSERRALCYLTRYHRGAVPRIGRDDYLTDADDAEQLYLTLAYLRAADALDNRNLVSPKLEFTARRDRIKITAILSEDTPRARRVYKRRQKFKLLEELLQVELKVRLDVATAAA